MLSVHLCYVNGCSFTSWLNHNNSNFAGGKLAHVVFSGHSLVFKKEEEFGRKTFTIISVELILAVTIGDMPSSIKAVAAVCNQTIVIRK